RAGLVAAEHSAEAAVNAISPRVKTRLRPYRSARRPAGTSAAASAIVYAESVQDIVANETSGKELRMSSKATNSTCVSRKTMNAARLATPRTAQGLTVRLRSEVMARP